MNQHKYVEKDLTKLAIMQYKYLTGKFPQIVLLNRL